MTISELSLLIDEIISETIKKVDGKYVVYPKKGGDRLGTHPSKEKALAQLRAIEANRDESISEIKDDEVRYWAMHADLFDLLKKVPDRYSELSAKLVREKKSFRLFLWYLFSRQKYYC